MVFDDNPPVSRVRGLLSPAECAALVQLALTHGLRPSLPAERALHPGPLLAALRRPLGLLDTNGDGVVDGRETAAAARAALNAPAFGEREAKGWLQALVPALTPDSAEPQRLATPASSANLTLAVLPGLSSDARVASATRAYFEALFRRRPETFTRFSRQVAVPWHEIAALPADGDGRSALERIAAFMRWPASVVEQGEPMQVIRYDEGGHYAPHSDSGWPGHRLVSLLIYLQAPEKGGETCFLPARRAAAVRRVVADAGGAAYARQCASRLVAAGAFCVSPRVGDAVAWENTWLETTGVGTSIGGAGAAGASGGSYEDALEDSAEVPVAHVACPVIEGTKWVASGWVQEPCAPGHICG
eukprot:TRINITY_DN28754_c0_g1_i2.p1 TRINITY_DN28754_c0_g1~~TRINITY_DN28754_c0_g1_i2.p1  ORF type:complete len:359 (-),score=76.66 TRINITY_DN28754_c0_g1_i2:81-1157(-)